MLKQLLQASLVLSGVLVLAGCEIDNAFLTDDAPYQSHTHYVSSNQTNVVVVRNKTTNKQVTRVTRTPSAPVSTGYQVPSSGPVSTGYQVPSSSEPVSTGYQVGGGDSQVSTGYQVGGEGSNVTGQYNG